MKLGMNQTESGWSKWVKVEIKSGKRNKIDKIYHFKNLIDKK